MRFTKTLVPFLGVLLLGQGQVVPARAAAPTKGPAAKFIRIKRDAQDHPVALETAIVHYVPASGQGGVEVDLVSAVHVGDKPYYQELNKQFKQYDVVLYELVAPPGTRIPRGGNRHSDNPLAMLQQVMKAVLGLELQTEQIDYTAKNFVHADLSPDAMAKAIEARGDDALTLSLSVAADLLRQQNLLRQKAAKAPAREEEEPDVLGLLLDPDGPAKLKEMLAEQLVAAETPGSGLGPTVDRILIRDRNEAALKVFQKELAGGKKKIAIFYGAGHMPDFERHLKEDFGLRRDRARWLTAWDLQAGGQSNLENLLDLLGDLDR
jgi:hypothetical protein